MISILTSLHLHCIQHLEYIDFRGRSQTIRSQLNPFPGPFLTQSFFQEFLIHTELACNKATNYPFINQLPPFPFHFLGFQLETFLPLLLLLPYSFHCFRTFNPALHVEPLELGGFFIFHLIFPQQFSPPYKWNNCNSTTKHN